MKKPGPYFKSLLEDIRKKGQLVPILVRRMKKKHRYELIDGAERIKALLVLGEDTVFATVIDQNGVPEPGTQELVIIQIKIPKKSAYCSWCPQFATKYLMHQPFCDECGKQFAEVHHSMRNPE